MCRVIVIAIFIIMNLQTGRSLAESKLSPLSFIIGSWSENCSAAASKYSAWQIFFLTGPGQVSKIFYAGGLSSGVIADITDLRFVGDEQLIFTITINGHKNYNTSKINGASFRTMEVIDQDGTVKIKDGVIINPSMETPWYHRCGEILN